MLKNLNEVVEYYSLLGCFFAFLFICFVMLFCGFFLGDKGKNNIKHIPFESGIIPVGNARIRFSVKFYLIAVFFVIFDVETPYLYTWVVNIYNNGFYGFFVACTFIITLLISLFYLIRVGILEYF